MLIRVCRLVFLLTLIGVAPCAAQTATGFVLSRTVLLGMPDKWDYLTYDQANRRLYIAHGSEVTVVDGRSGAVIGRLAGLNGAHGIALVPDLGRGYVTNDGRITSFDLETLAPTGDIATDAGADAVVFDPASHRVFSINGKAASATAVDPANNRATATIALGGKPEFAVADGRGKVFVNLESTSEILRIDTAALRVDARWPMADCRDPHGLAIDTAQGYLFASCANARLIVVDAASGAVIAALAIGNGSDAVVYDPVRKVVFSSNGDGTLSMIQERDSATFIPLDPMSTAAGGRTMALDETSGRVFVVTADIAPEADAKAGPHRRAFVSGTVKVLIFDPR